MSMFAKLRTAAAVAFLTFGTSIAMATDIDTRQDDAFYSFFTTILGWVNGPLGVGLALFMLLMGAGIGVAKNSPMPALSGVAGAAFLHWGPAIIIDLASGGSLI